MCCFSIKRKKMNKLLNEVLTLGVIAASVALSACGGGGGGSSGPASPATTASAPPAASSPGSTTSATSANVSTPQYAAASAQLALFQTVNQYRQQCGFGELTENTTLDTATSNHASYLGLNATVTDTETAGNPGFTGVTWADRAVAAGYPQGVTVVGASAADNYTQTTLTETQYGQELANEWLGGVYHVGIEILPATEIGIGVYQMTYQGYPEVWGALSLGNFNAAALNNGPLTFPCQGTTGVPYEEISESPTPPNTSGPWGTPIAVAGNLGDTLVLASGTMTGPSGPVVNLQLLDSANDPNKSLPAYEGVAYPTTPLQPNTTYSVTITGTDNGTAFSRSFTFTTGNVTG
jgi:uncharacterized protein YkwD